MSRTWRSRTVGYDNIAVGSVYGLENISAGNATPAQNPVDDISSANVSPENLENLITSTGTKSISPAASGTEIP